MKKFGAGEVDVEDMRYMPCYVPAVAQQGDDPDCALFVGKYFERLLNGDPIDPENYQPDVHLFTHFY